MYLVTVRRRVLRGPAEMVKNIIYCALLYFSRRQKQTMYLETVRRRVLRDPAEMVKNTIYCALLYFSRRQKQTINLVTVRRRVIRGPAEMVKNQYIVHYCISADDKSRRCTSRQSVEGY